MSWHLGRLAGFDTETTGVDVETDRIVTACIVEVGGNTPPITANWLINPGIDIPTGVQPLTDVVGDELHVVDPRVIDKHLDMYRKGKRTLTDLCRHYRVVLDGAHSADADAIATCRVAWRLGNLYPQLAELPVWELHKAQAEWHAEWAAGFEAHLRGKGETDAVIDGSWPLRPVGGEA